MIHFKCLKWQILYFKYIFYDKNNKQQRKTGAQETSDQTPGNKKNSQDDDEEKFQDQRDSSLERKGSTPEVAGSERKWTRKIISYETYGIDASLRISLELRRIMLVFLA